MITLLGEGILYDLHRNKHAMLLQSEKRKALFLVCMITLCVTIATLIYIIYG